MMSFTDKLKKGLQDATRVGSPELDERKKAEDMKGINAEIERIKCEMGELVYISYKRGDPIDQMFIQHCERIDNLIKKGNNANDTDVNYPQSNSGDVGSYDESGKVN